MAYISDSQYALGVGDDNVVVVVGAGVGKPPPTFAEGAVVVVVLVGVVVVGGDVLFFPPSIAFARARYVWDSAAGLLHGTFLFRCIVECLLSRGIDVIHIRPEAVNASGAQEQIDALVKLLGYRGEYIPKNLGPMPAEPSHSILIPGVAAVQLMAANSPFCDSVIIIPRQCDEQYRLLASNIEGVSRRRGPVAAFVAAGSFNQCDTEQVPGNLFSLLRSVRQIDTALEQLDTVDGERDVLKGGLTSVTCPTSQLAERRRRFWKAFKNESFGEVLDSLVADLDTSAARRRDAYVRNVIRYRHTDVVTKCSIETFVRTGSFDADNLDEAVAFRDDYLGIDLPTPAERAEHLRSIVSDLRDYPNYELLLADGDELNDLKGSGWAVKSRGLKGNVAFFEAIRTRRRTNGGLAQSYAAWQITQEPLVDQISRHAQAECARLREICPTRAEVVAFLLERSNLLDTMT